MDEGELDFPSEQMLSSWDMSHTPSSFSFDIDEFLAESQVCNDVLGQTEAYADVLGRTQSCTHAHTCHPSGPDKSHSHTCIHVHTQILPSSSGPQAPSDDTAKSVDESSSKKRPMGNREAVRKYREKKKARAASLEDEIDQLRALNQQLMKRLQSQSSLEAEITRLKCLLVDIRGRIGGEIGSFPYQKAIKSGDVYQSGAANPNLPGTYVMNPCNVQPNDQLHCIHPGSETGLNDQGLGDCRLGNVQCLGNQNLDLKKILDCGAGNVGVLSGGHASGSNKQTEGLGLMQ